MAPPPEGTTLPAVDLDPEAEITPFALLGRLRDGEPVLLVDVRADPGALGFRGATRRTEPGWTPPAGRPTVLFDDDGTTARPLARRLRADGHDAVALFGGLRLYDFSLDPQVVGAERYLEGRLPSPARSDGGFETSRE